MLATLDFLDKSQKNKKTSTDVAPVLKVSNYILNIGEASELQASLDKKTRMPSLDQVIILNVIIDIMKTNEESSINNRNKANEILKLALDNKKARKCNDLIFELSSGERNAKITSHLMKDAYLREYSVKDYTYNFVFVAPIEKYELSQKTNN